LVAIDVLAGSAAFWRRFSEAQCRGPTALGAGRIKRQRCQCLARTHAHVPIGHHVEGADADHHHQEHVAPLKAFLRHQVPATSDLEQQHHDGAHPEKDLVVGALLFLLGRQGMRVAASLVGGLAQAKFFAKYGFALQQGTHGQGPRKPWNRTPVHRSGARSFRKAGRSPPPSLHPATLKLATCAVLPVGTVHPA